MAAMIRLLLLLVMCSLLAAAASASDSQASASVVLLPARPEKPEKLFERIETTQVNDFTISEAVLDAAEGLAAPYEYYSGYPNDSLFDISPGTLLRYIYTPSEGYTVCQKTETIQPFVVTDEATELDLELDDYVQIELPFTFEFFGTDYTQAFVGSHGYITFGGGDTDYTASVADHFDMPRISTLFTDIDPRSGVVSFEILPGGIEAVVVTFSDVQNTYYEYYDDWDPNTFQVCSFCMLYGQALGAIHHSLMIHYALRPSILRSSILYLQ